MAPGARSDLCHTPAASLYAPLQSGKTEKPSQPGLRRVYTAVNAEAAGKALDELEEQWGNRYPDAPILSNPVLVRCEGGELLVVSGGEVVVVVEASFEP